MQTPSTTQIRTAIEVLKKFGEHINTNAANEAIGLHESPHFDQQAARIGSRTIEQGKLKVKGARRCGNRNHGPRRISGNAPKSGWSCGEFAVSLDPAMPYPLAHPAAVLPLWPLCPRYLSFPALIVGSLSPDAGYLFDQARFGAFTHRFLAGSFGFCLPAGLLMLLVFHLVRARLVRILPDRLRLVYLPLCEEPVGSTLRIVASLLIGSWTHIFLDSITHEDGWLVEHLPILQSALPLLGKHEFKVYELLYAGCTFAGVALLAVAYLRWLETTASAAGSGRPRVKWPFALLLAAATLFIASASRGMHRSIGVYPAGVISLLTVSVFFLGTGRLFTRTRS